MNIIVNVSKIQNARIKKGLSQRELARKAGISTLCVNYLEQKKSVPRPATIVKICNVLDLDIMDIYHISSNEKN